MGHAFQSVVLFGSIGERWASSGSLLEGVDGDHHGNPKESGVLNLLLHVTTALLQQPQVLHTHTHE